MERLLRNQSHAKTTEAKQSSLKTVHLWLVFIYTYLPTYLHLAIYPFTQLVSLAK